MKKSKKIILSLVAILITLGLCEWFIRTYYTQITLESASAFSFYCFEEGKHRWIKLSSNKSCELKSAWNSFPPVEVKTNSLGLRNPEVTLPKPADTKRILFVGDSFTMGWGVKEQETFTRMTERLLNEKGLTNKVETINAGFTAAGPSGYYIYLKHFGLTLDPDIIVIGFFIGNDITARTDVEWVQTDEQGMPDVTRSKTTFIDTDGTIRFRDTPFRYRIPFLRDSHAFLLLADLINPQVTSSAPSKDKINQLTCLFKKECHDLDTAKSEVKFLFSGIQKLVSEKGKKLVVMLIPDDYQVNAYPAYAVNNGLPLLPSDRRRVNNEFVSFFQQEGIRYIDLLPVFMEKAKEPLYFREDRHWNTRGHEFAAAVISEELAKILSEQ